MKAISFTKLIPALVLGIFLAANVQARNDGYTDREGVRKSKMVKLNAQDIRDIQKFFSLTDAVEVTWNHNQLLFTTRNGEELSLPEFVESRQAPEVEGWMLESEYLNDEPAVPVESWMSEIGYLDTESQPIEGWMFDADRYAEPETGTAIESWMMDANYLSR